MDCVKVKQENAVEIEVEEIFDGNNDSDDTNDPFDNCSDESVDPFENSSNESGSKYDSDNDTDPFKEGQKYQPINVKGQVKAIQNKVHKNSQETLTLNNQVINETSSTRATVGDFTILPNNKCSCNHCKLVCTQKTNMYRHIKEKHMKVPRNAPKVKQCPYCSFTSKHGLTNHINFKHKEGANIITNHKEESKKPSNILKDQVVDKSSSTKATVRDFTILPNNKCSCNHCKLVCTQKTNMYRHIKETHMKVPRNAPKVKQCPYCSYTSKYGLINHINATHKESANIIINHKEESKKPSDLLKDQVVDKSPSTKATVRDFTILPNNKCSCNHCKLVCTQRTNMYRHIKEKHMKVPRNAPKVKQCPYCSYTSTYGLTNHINATHKESANIITNHKEESKKPSDVLKDQVVDKSPSTIATFRDFTILPNNKCICNYCKLVYTQKSNMYRHIKEKHRNIPRNAPKVKQCPYCSFTSNNGLTNHINATHKERFNETDYKILANKEYGCSHCEFVAKTRLFIYKHHRKYHLKLEGYKQCPYCPYKTKYTLKKHIQCRHKKKSEVECYECHQCGYKFKDKGPLRNHLLTHKTNEEKMDQMTKCDQCSKMYLKSKLDAHKRDVHEGYRQKTHMNCYFCDYKSFKKKYLEEHIKRYHDNNENLKMLRCEKCSFETKFDFLLRRHIRSNHTEMHQCEKCPYQGSTLEKMRLHTISHQKVKNESDLKYRCDKCDYKTYRIYSLHVHKLKHLKPEEIQYFYCYHCDFKAKRKDNLKTHIKNHFKKKIEFVCYICDFKTNSKVSHIAHLEKHSREQNKKQNSKANYEDKKEKRKGQSSSKNNENTPLKRRKVRENDNDMSVKLEENETVPLKSLNVNKTSDQAMTMRNRTKRKVSMPSLSQKYQKAIQS